MYTLKETLKSLDRMHGTKHMPDFVLIVEVKKSDNHGLPVPVTMLGDVLNRKGRRGKARNSLLQVGKKKTFLKTAEKSFKEIGGKNPMVVAIDSTTIGTCLHVSKKEAKFFKLKEKKMKKSSVLIYQVMR